MRRRALFVFSMACLLIVSPLARAADDKPVARITATFGEATVDGPAGKRPAELHTLISNEERLTTNGGGLSVLLASRVVLKLDANTTLRISEGLGQTNLHLEHGTVHVFVGKRPASMGAVAVLDTNVRAEAVNGVFLASYDPQSRSGYYACEDGSVRLEPITSGQPTTLVADKQAIVDDGTRVEVATLDRQMFDGQRHSIDRLGATAMTSNSETFRLRSRTLDLQVAVSQLAAAGWIDPQALTASAGQQKAASSQDKKKESGGNTGSKDASGNETKSSSTPSEGVSDNPVIAETEQPTETPAASGAAAVQTPSVVKVETPAETPVQADIVDVPSTPAADAPVVIVRGQVTVTPPAAAVAPVTVTPPAVDLEIKPAGVDVKETVSADIGADLPVANDVAAPVADIKVEAPPIEVAAPKIDLDLGDIKGAGKKDLAIAPPAPDLVKVDAAPKIDLGGDIAKPNIKIDAPKLDVAPVAEVKAPPAVEVPHVADIGIDAPKVDMDLDNIVTPKDLKLDKGGITKDLPVKDAVPDVTDKVLTDKIVPDVKEVKVPKIEVPTDAIAKPADLPSVKDAIPDVKIDAPIVKPDVTVPAPDVPDVKIDVPKVEIPDIKIETPTDLKTDLPNVKEVLPDVKIEVPDVKTDVPTDTKGGTGAMLDPPKEIEVVGAPPDIGSVPADGGAGIVPADIGTDPPPKVTDVTNVPSDVPPASPPDVNLPSVKEIDQPVVNPDDVVQGDDPVRKQDKDRHRDKGPGGGKGKK